MFFIWYKSGKTCIYENDMQMLFFVCLVNSLLLKQQQKKTKKKNSGNTLSYHLAHPLFIWVRAEKDKKERQNVKKNVSRKLKKAVIQTRTGVFEQAFKWHLKLIP